MHFPQERCACLLVFVLLYREGAVVVSPDTCNDPNVMDKFSSGII